MFGGRTYILESFLLLLQPLVGVHELLLGLIEIVLQLLHLLLQLSDLFLSLNEVSRVNRGWVTCRG